MIKTYSLQFASQEIEQIYRQSLLSGIKYRREYTYGILSIYLGLIIIKYNFQEVLLPQIFAGIGIALELALFFFMKKYWQNKEILITLNLILMAAIWESIRLFEFEDYLWYYGQHSSSLKLIIYLQGSQFLIQSFIFCCSQAVGIYNFNQYDVTTIISHCLITLILVMLRYQYEIISRKNFLSRLSKEQYENVIEDLLPSWVVVLKYNKLVAQLQIEKINKNLKEKFNLQNNEALRDFLRKLNLDDLEINGLQQNIKIEHEIIQILKSKSQDHPVQRYLGNLEKDVNSKKQYRFKITQVYFKAFEPLVILLFEEIKEDKYDQFINQIEQRDIQQYHNSKVGLSSITLQMQLIQQVHSQIQMSSLIKKDNNILQNLQKIMQQCYYLYNLNNNLWNLHKISHKQIKYEYQDIQIEQFFKNLCDNLLIKYKSSKMDIMNFSYKKESIKTDKNKLISIIMNLMEFMKILLSIIHTEENIIQQVHPFKKPFSLSIKQSKIHNDSIQITLTHPNLNITSSIINLIQNIQPVSIDDKKRNWNNKNYYDMINNLNQTLSQMIDHYKNDIQQSLTSIGIGLQNTGQQYKIHQNNQQKQFNTLGFIMAQYFISQLGPFNKVNFKQALIENDIINPQYISALYQTKIQFTIYKDLQNFSREVSKLEKNFFDENQFFSQKKYTNQQITDRLFQIQIEDLKKNIY